MTHKVINIKPSYTILAHPVFIILGVVGAVFFAYEFSSGFWLQDLENQTLFRLHQMRGVFFLMITSLLVGWFLVKASPSLFSSTISTDSLTPIVRPDNQERLTHFIRWFILMRWIAIVVAWILTYLIVFVAEWLPKVVWWPLAFTIVGLTILNVAYEYLLYKGLLRKYLLEFQAYADLVILVILLHFSGGIENPLSLLMLFHVIIAGIVLNRKHCYAVAASASILLAMVATAEASGLLNHYTLTLFPHIMHDGEMTHASHQFSYVISFVGLMSVIFFLTAYFVVTLADRIRQNERQFEKFADYTVEQRQLIEKALETTHTGLCVCNSKAVPYWTNQRWESWFGKQTIDTFARAYQLKETVHSCNSMKDGEKRINEILLPVDGAPERARTIRVTSAPLLDKDGCQEQVVSLAQDITEQKKAQTQLIRTGRLAAVGELAGHIAHEVNNPIGIISAKCRLLIGDYPEELTPRVHKELEKITGAADRVAHIAKGLLSYCRPSPAVHTELDIRIPIREAVAMIGQRAQMMNINIDDQLPRTLPSVNGNAGELQQVFLNLFLNALDAMPTGGTLSISAREDGLAGKSNQWLVIRIRDTGTGIPDDVIEQIFEPFFTTKEEGKGTGLGLSICAGLIRSHGGTIDVQGKQGTSVQIRLPLNVKAAKQSS